MISEFKVLVVDMIDDIYGIKLVQVNKNLTRLVDGLLGLSTNFRGDNSMKLNEVMNGLLIAMENKDYLLLSDILKYDLLPIIDLQLKVSLEVKTNE